MPGFGDKRRTETEAGRITPQQAETIWSVQSWKTGYDSWLADLENAEAKEAALEAAVAKTNLTVEEYENLLKAADANGNSSVTQDELGEYLIGAVKAGRMSAAEAEAVWNTKGWKKPWDAWRAKR